MWLGKPAPAIVKSREMTSVGPKHCRAGGEGVKTTENKVHWPSCYTVTISKGNKRRHGGIFYNPKIFCVHWGSPSDFLLLNAREELTLCGVYCENVQIELEQFSKITLILSFSQKTAQCSFVTGRKYLEVASYLTYFSCSIKVHIEAD